MDPTPTDELISQLADADPAEAPDPADAVAAALSEELESDEGDEAAPPA